MTCHVVPKSTPPNSLVTLLTAKRFPHSIIAVKTPLRAVVALGSKGGLYSEDDTNGSGDGDRQVPRVHVYLNKEEIYTAA